MSEEKKTAARRWVNGYTAAGTAIVIAAVIPGMTSTALCGMEAHMCYQIGKIYRGDKYTMQEALAAARVIGVVAIAAPLVAMEALNALPFAGWAIKGGLAGGVIKTLGEAIIAHYERLERQEIAEAPKDELPVINISATIQPPPIAPQLPAPGASAHDRLQKLQELLDRKLITQTEYDAKRQQILAEI